MKEKIRDYAMKIGADDVGFAAAADYSSQKAPDLKKILPTVQSMVVLAYRELDGTLESPNPRTGMTGRFSIMELAKTNNYLLARYIENTFHVKTAPVSVSYPLDMAPPTHGLTGDVSLRHAAVAAGLGIFGRHNLVIHPKFGSRVVFTAFLTELPLESDQRVTEELCDNCNLCVENCPAKALDEEGKTSAMKCLKVSQPNGIGGIITFAAKLTEASAEDKTKMIFDPKFFNICQSLALGFEYHCFRCMAVCPAGRS
jgi:epoxyqueuosine reductase QueG